LLSRRKRHRKQTLPTCQPVTKWWQSSN
jgi:hypothetical protein